MPPGERFSLPLARAYAALSQAAFCPWDAPGDTMALTRNMSLMYINVYYMYINVYYMYINVY